MHSANDNLRSVVTYIAQYALEQGGGRSTAEQALGDPEALVIAFARWVEARPARLYRA